MRIVSMIASATEIVCALGLEEHLVGRSHECDYPESIKRLPCCTAPRFDVHGLSADIDRLVRQTLNEAPSVYRVFDDVLRELQPDLIVTQSQCEVCAVSLKDVESAVCNWPAAPRICTLLPNCLEDVFADIQRVADAAGVPERGAALVMQMRNELRAISDRANGWGRKPTVACLEWLDPVMAAGNWMPELVRAAGGINLFGEAGKHSPNLEWSEVVRQDPDIIIAMPCGFDLERTRQEMPALTNRPEWRRLRAVQNGRFWIADGNAYFNRPGPRLIDALEMLAAAIVPGAFAFSHMGMEVY
jgi:iron complex transport system substrate-binding protein